MDFIINHIGALIGILVFLGGLAGTVWKMSTWVNDKIINVVDQILKNQDQFTKRVDGWEKDLKAVSKIVGYEFQKNGGGSSIDKIDRIEKAVNIIIDRQLIDFYLDHQPKYECDSNGYCIRVNYRWREITGLSEEEALGNQWLKAVHLKDRESLQKDWELFINKSIPFEREYRILHPQTLEEIKVFGRAIKKQTDKSINIIIGTFDIIKETKNAKNNQLAKSQ